MIFSCPTLINQNQNSTSSLKKKIKTKSPTKEVKGKEGKLIRKQKQV